MSLKVERVALGSKASENAYRDFCERCPQVVAQQTLEWCYAIKDLGPDEPFLLMAKEGETVVGILPAYLYRNPLGNVLTSVPQPGPLGGVAADPKYPNRKPVYKALLGAMEEVAKDEGCLTMTVITSPFLDDRDLYEGCGPWKFTLDNFCQTVRLEEFFGTDGVVAYKGRPLRHQLPQTELAARTTLCIPLFSQMTDAQQDRVIEEILKVVEG